MYSSRDQSDGCHELIVVQVNHESFAAFASRGGVVRGIPRPASELQVRIESPPPAREGGGFPQYFPPLDQPPIDCTNVLSFVIRKKNTEEPLFIGQLPLDRPRFRSISVTD
mgnify:CR=1 FL=1